MKRKIKKIIFSKNLDKIFTNFNKFFKKPYYININT